MAILKEQYLGTACFWMPFACLGPSPSYPLRSLPHEKISVNSNSSKSSAACDVCLRLSHFCVLLYVLCFDYRFALATELAVACWYWTITLLFLADYWFYLLEARPPLRPLLRFELITGSKLKGIPRGDSCSTLCNFSA
jgi:hypothetical protein